jgi:hypothetical protein
VEVRPPLPILLAALAALLGPACGAKTGLLIPDADDSMDASIVRDTGADVHCPDVPIPLTRTEVETVFLMDGSGSMGLTWEGLPAGAGEPARWSIVRDTLEVVLPPFDERIAFGAKVFPDGPDCEIGPGLDVVPHLGATDEVLALFDSWIPEGGTPTAQALLRTLDALEGRPRATAHVIVATLDGGPNCNDDPGVPGDTCICTGPRRACLAPPPDGPRSCLDATAMIGALRESYEVRGIPVVIVGIDDPLRPDLSDFLDEMALAGGWPRPEGSTRRFFIAREPEDLRTAFVEIADLISHCVYVASFTPPEDATVVVRLDGRVVPRDTSHVDGWDWTDRANGTLAFFGPACDTVRPGDVEVTADLTCPE